jgi:tetratricopeptide (TPR) repeat protein
VENHDIKGEIDVELINSKAIDVQGAFSADIKINKIYVLLNENNLEEADKLLDEIILESNNKNSQKTYLLAKAEKIYVSILLKPIEDALKYYEENVSISERRDIAEHNSMTCVRAYMLASALLDKSRSECTLTIKRAYKAYKRTPDSRKNLEIKLFNQALNKIVEARPNWELAQYKMNEENKVD